MFTIFFIYLYQLLVFLQTRKQIKITDIITTSKPKNTLTYHYPVHSPLR